MLAELGRVSLEALTFAGTADLDGSETHYAAVDGAGDTPLLLNKELGKVEVLLVECKVVFDVSLGGAVNEVAHLESLDGFVLANESGAVVAADGLCKSLVLLASSVISSFGWHNLIIINSQNTPYSLLYFNSTSN